MSQSDLDTTDNSPITLMIQEWSSGSGQSIPSSLAEEIYKNLYQIACAHLPRESKPGIDATELVNEAWLRISESQHSFTSRRHFFAFAALQMRRLLVDIARSAYARNNNPVTLSSRIIDPALQPTSLASLANALDRLEEVDPRKLQSFALVEMAGFTTEQAAEILDISRSTLERDLRFTRVWLASRMTL